MEHLGEKSEIITSAQSDDRWLKIMLSNKYYAERYIGSENVPGWDKVLEKWGSRERACKCAERTDEFNGWRCSIIEGACMYFMPDSKRCAKEYGLGPDAEGVDKDEEQQTGKADKKSEGIN